MAVVIPWANALIKPASRTAHNVGAAHTQSGFSGCYLMPILKMCVKIWQMPWKLPDGSFLILWTNCATSHNRLKDWVQSNQIKNWLLIAPESIATHNFCQIIFDDQPFTANCYFIKYFWAWSKLQFRPWKWLVFAVTDWIWPYFVHLIFLCIKRGARLIKFQWSV